MDAFTFIPQWIIQDIIVLLMAVIGIIFIVKNEENPVSILLEFICFIFLYAAVYENFATVLGLYGFGKSIVMVFNVPITIPVIEYLVVYTAIRFLSYIKMPTWTKPFIVGFMGMLFDFTLDPLALKQVFTTHEGVIGRWTWFIGSNDVHIFNAPVYNFPGWVLLCGYAAAFLLLGRWWLKKSGGNKIVAIAYPVLAMIAALFVMVSPISQFLLWLGPIFSKGGVSEWIMLGVWFLVPTVLFLIYGRRYTKTISIKKEYLIFLIYGLSHVVNLIFALIGQHYILLPLIIGIGLLQNLILYLVYLRSKKPKYLYAKNI
ncbi:MAG: hypothetical protein KAU44_07555 [Candidatus Marinimicrobia bacterium]|nr:hypothetical protein [Candidatus Neomarinimicrobiota bacterium]